MSTAAASHIDSQFSTTPSIRWVIHEVDESLVNKLANSLGISPIAARVLAGRGLNDPDACRLFLKPSLAQIHDPFLLHGIEKAVIRIGQAIGNNEKIYVYGDYDVDGVCSTAVIHHTLSELGARVAYYIPHRIREGYGLNCEALDSIAAEGAGVVITVDNGISACREADHARELGLDLIVTDHHEPGPELPDAFVIINPKQIECPYPFKSLAGVGVAFKLAHAALKRLHPDETKARELLGSMLDLVTMGTVADIVPLLGENRAIVSAGLPRIQSTQRVGLAQLLRRSSLAKRKITTSSIGYGLGPRINAAGRTEHATFGVELLLTNDPREAELLSEKLETFNNQRRSIEMNTAEEAIGIVEEQGLYKNRVIVVAQKGWHHGVLGIVASRVLARYYRPTIVISIDGDSARGSARSVMGFDMHQALHHCDDILEQYGGHKMAAGMNLKATRLEDFCQKINAFAMDALTEEALVPMIRVDTEASSDDLTETTLRCLEQMEPFGESNPRPMLVVKDASLVDEPQILKEKHIKLRMVSPCGNRIAALGWGMIDRVEELQGHRGVIELAGSPFINEWNGRISIEIELKDFRVPS